MNQITPNFNSKVVRLAKTINLTEKTVYQIVKQKNNKLV